MINKFDFPNATIDHWPDTWEENWHILQYSLMKTQKKMGKSDLFFQRANLIKIILQKGEFSRLQPLLRDRLTVRVMTELWLHDDAFRKLTLKVRILKLVFMRHAKLTRISLLNLSEFYFKFYKDQKYLAEAKEINFMVQEFLVEQYQKINLNTQDKAIKFICEHQELFFSKDAVENFANFLVKHKISLSEICQVHDLEWVIQGNFGALILARYYLEKFLEVPAHQAHPILNELSKKECYQLVLDEKTHTLVGHEIIKNILDRADPTIWGDDPWLSTLLTIAGDPRANEEDKHRRTWWNPLGNYYLNKAYAWLCYEDLQIFIKVLATYSEQQGADLARLFPARSQFLIGIFASGKVRNTRLFLGRKLQVQLEKMLGHKLEIAFTPLTEEMQDQAVIYLKCNEFCLIEGSHSFRVWLYLDEPYPELLERPLEQEVSYQELTQSMPHNYEEIYKRQLPYKALTHHPHLVWQAKIISFLAENGIELQPELLFCEQDYQAYLQKFVVPKVATKKPSYRAKRQVSPVRTLRPRR
ncbi:EH_Signature domain-containing protein [Allopseudospirillum japonicum]|uniref:EH_Signature domain-containing protein n=1 Tax=Allopseudospirillum japonicum TaxID=64971 RepID=A0A1H6Q0J7_9GAMM|nr:EH signature domain-containing protein [Allopseudospirillum japonicum]SEI37368.1 EH_Signature domain-containing protein [Allopseudospirillum japonicum]